MPASCHPVAMVRTEWLLKRGVMATADTLTTWRRSVSQSPRSNSALFGTVTVWSDLVLKPWKYPVQCDQVQFAFMLIPRLTLCSRPRVIPAYRWVPDGSH